MVNSSNKLGFNHSSPHWNRNEPWKQWQPAMMKQHSVLLGYFYQWLTKNKELFSGYVGSELPIHATFL